MENIFKFCENLKIPYERFSLLLLSFLFLLLDDKYYNNYLYVCIISFFSSLIILSNFPFIIIWNNAKPIYYEDLYVDSEKLPELPLDEKQKEVYDKVYKRSLVFSSSMLVSVLITYWKFKTQGRSLFEIIGITGGLLQIASVFNSICGRIILYLIKTFITIQVNYEVERRNSEVGNDLDELM